MTPEEKKLLYKDLSARQPYRPFICFAGKFTMPFLDVIASTKSNELMSINGLDPEYVKPYLRPISSMTEEEKKEFQACHCVYELHPDFQPMMCNLANELNMFDWLNSHHFDYRGLIEKGLALEALEGMYKIS